LRQLNDFRQLHIARGSRANGIWRKGQADVRTTAAEGKLQIEIALHMQFARRVGEKTPFWQFGKLA